VTSSKKADAVSKLLVWRLPALLFVLLVLFIWSYQPHRRVEIDLTARSNQKFLDHFYPAENGARWTEARSAVWLPSLGGANLPWRIGMRLSGAGRRPLDLPARIVITANTTRLADFFAGSEDEDYEWEIPAWATGLNGDLLAEIDSNPFAWPGDQREFGVRIARIWISQGDGVALPSVRAFSLTLALVGSIGLLLSMLLRGLLGRKELPAGFRFFDPFRNRWAWVMVAVCASAVVIRALNKPEGAWWLQTITFSVLFVVGMIWGIARLVARSLTQKQAACLLILFFAAAAIRIPFDFGPGYQTDVSAYLSLAWKTVHDGIHSAYLNMAGVPPSDNPPILLYPFWLLGKFYQSYLSPLFGRTRLSEPDVLRFMLRIPSLAADLFAGALIFRFLRLRSSLSFRSIVLATGAYLLNPALIIDSSYWGQTAAIHTLFMLLSLILATQNAFAWAGAMLTVAILTKPQAIPILPVVLIIAWRARGVVRFAAGAIAATLLTTAPFILTGRIGDVVGQYSHATEIDPFIAINAHNFWWFISGGHGWISDTGSILLISFRTSAMLLFAGATLLSVVILWRDQRALFRVAAYQSLAFFMLSTQIHENHLLPMFAPLILAIALDGRGWGLYVAFALTAVANMLLHDPSLLERCGYSSEQMVYGTPVLAFVRWCNSAVQMALFLVFTLQLVLTRRTAGNDASNRSNALA
jgi:Gpi18-like mannosyltransferase